MDKAFGDEAAVFVAVLKGNFHEIERGIEVHFLDFAVRFQFLRGVVVAIFADRRRAELGSLRLAPSLGRV